MKSFITICFILFVSLSLSIYTSHKNNLLSANTFVELESTTLASDKFTDGLCTFGSKLRECVGLSSKKTAVGLEPIITDNLETSSVENPSTRSSRSSSSPSSLHKRSEIFNGIPFMHENAGAYRGNRRSPTLTFEEVLDGKHSPSSRTRRSSSASDKLGIETLPFYSPSKKDAYRSKM